MPGKLDDENRNGKVLFNEIPSKITYRHSERRKIWEIKPNQNKTKKSNGRAASRDKKVLKKRNPSKSIFLPLTPPRVLGQHPRTQHPSGSVQSQPSTETRWHSMETSFLIANDFVNQKRKPFGWTWFPNRIKHTRGSKLHKIKKPTASVHLNYMSGLICRIHQRNIWDDSFRLRKERSQGMERHIEKRQWHSIWLHCKALNEAILSLRKYLLRVYHTEHSLSR